MIEIVRFGAAWIAVLFLAGLTSIPPDPREFTCCLEPAEENRTLYEHLYEEIMGYFTLAETAVIKVTSDSPRLVGLCRKLEDDIWARVTEENQIQANGVILSAYCDLQESMLHLFKTIWVDGKSAVNVMSDEVSSGLVLVGETLHMALVVVSDTILYILNSIISFDVNQFIWSALSFLSGISLYKICVSLSEFLWSNLVNFPYILNCSSFVMGAMSDLFQIMLGIPQLIDSYSGGRMLHVPFFHSGYGLVTLIASLVGFLYTTISEALILCLTYTMNIAWGSSMAEIWSSVVSYFSSFSFNLSELNASILHYLSKVRSIVLPPVSHIREGMQTLSRNMTSPIVVFQGFCSTFWWIYTTVDRNQYTLKFFRAMVHGFGWYIVMPFIMSLGEILAYGSYLFGRYFISPVASVFIQVFAGVLTANQVRQITIHIAQLTWEVQSIVIFALRGISAAIDGTNLVLQKIGGLGSDTETKSISEEEALETSVFNYWQLLDIFLVCGLWALAYAVYRYGPGVYRDMCQSTEPDDVDTTVEEEIKQNLVQKTLAQQFMAVSLISSDENFRSFHMLSKHTMESVYLKCLRSCSSKEARIGLAKECRATRVLLHPNIVRFITWIRTGPVCALALEYTPFGDLKSAMSSIEPRFHLKDRLNAFRQILDAVKHLHNARAAHLNIRPGIILVFDKWSRVKLSGFSHTVKVSEEHQCTQYNLHHVAGPSEVILRRQPYNPYKADTWALGSLLFYLISGEYLHNKSNKPVPAILLPGLKECDIRHQKAILTLMTGLLCYDPMGRPPLGEVIRTLNELEK